MKKRVSQFVILFLALHVSASFIYAQNIRLPSPTPLQTRTTETTTPVLIQTSDQGTINLADPSVGVVIINDGGNLDIGIIDNVPPPVPTTAPTSAVIQNPTSAPLPTAIIPTSGSAINPVQPTSVPVIPTSTQGGGIITNPTSQPEPTIPSSIDIPVATPIIIRTQTPVPTINIPTSTPPPLVRVTPTPIPLPTPTNQPTILDPIVDIIDGIFGIDRDVPTTTVPDTGVDQPEFVLISPTPIVAVTPVVLVRVTPTPIPLPTPTDQPTILDPVIDPIVDIIDGIFGNDKDVPTTRIDPSTGETQPEFVLISPTPTPAPIPVIGDTIKAINDFLSGNVETDSLSKEQKAILAESFVADKSSEIQALFIQASDIISPQISALLGLQPNAGTRLPDSSQQIIESYLANYQLNVVADREGNVVVERGDASVKIPVPIIVNPQNRSFSVVTEKGTIPVTYYPDTIKDELELSRLINDDLDMTLGLKDEELVYVAQGCEAEFMFAFLPVCPQKEIVISARDMNIHAIRQSTISRAVDALSI